MSASTCSTWVLAAPVGHALAIGIEDIRFEPQAQCQAVFLS
jgi:hypothetical protein